MLNANQPKTICQNNQYDPYRRGQILKNRVEQRILLSQKELGGVEIDKGIWSNKGKEKLYAFIIYIDGILTKRGEVSIKKVV